jgi:hypothetical protein
MKVMELGNYNEAFLICLPIVVSNELDIGAKCLRMSFEERVDPQVDEDCGIRSEENALEIYNLDGLEDMSLNCLAFTQKGGILNENEYFSRKESYCRSRMEVHLR